MFFPLFLLSPWPSATQLEGKTEKLKMCVSFPFLSSASPFTTFKNCFPLTCPSFSDLYSFLPSKFSLQADTWHLSKSWTWIKKCWDPHLQTLLFPPLLPLTLHFLLVRLCPCVTSVRLHRASLTPAFPLPLSPLLSTHCLLSLLLLLSPLSSQISLLAHSPLIV